MTFNIVDICQVGDKKENYLLEVNKLNGHKVHQFGDRQVVLIVTDFTWKCPTVNFKKVPDGLYVVRNNQLICVEG